MNAETKMRQEITDLLKSMSHEQLLEALEIVEGVYLEEQRAGRLINQQPPEPAPPQA